MHRYPTIHLVKPRHQGVEPGLEEIGSLAVEHVQAGDEDQVGLEVMQVGQKGLQHGHLRVGGIVAADEASCHWCLHRAPSLPHLAQNGSEK